MKDLHENSSDSLDEIIKQLAGHATADTKRRNLSNLRSLQCRRLYVCMYGTLRIEGRLGKAALPTDKKFPMVLPSRHSFTRLLMLNCHEECTHRSIQYILMLTRRHFWIIKGLSFIRYYTGPRNACIIRRAHPSRQLMADLPAFRMAINKELFANSRCNCYSKLACFGFKQKPFALQDSNHYVFEQKTFCNMRKGTPISIIDKMSCLLSLYVVDELFCLVMFSFFFLDP